MSLPIRTSIEGRKFGLGDNNQPVVHANTGAGIAGHHLWTPNKVRLFDDFLGDVIADQWNFQEGTDSGTSNAAINVANNGTLRMTTGDTATATMAVNGAQLESALNWKAANGGLVFEARVTLDVITNVALFIGLTDQVSALEMPINSAASADTITTNASDAVGFMFDTAMATDNWWLVGVDTDVDATAQNSTKAPVAATYQTLRIEVDTGGIATFYIDGAQVGTAMTGAVTPSVALTPVFAGFARTTTSLNLDIDYVFVEQTRA